MPLPTELDFEWDEDKAAQNLKKHKVTFDEAKTAFGDPFSITIDDPSHSIDEKRFIDIGISAKGKMLVVSYIERGKKIRLISCRKATKVEQEMYEERKGF
ncbi:BrnT family toxin [soil metagenome]